MQQLKKLLGLGSGPGDRMRSGTMWFSLWCQASGCRTATRQDATQEGVRATITPRSSTADVTLDLDRHGWRADARTSSGGVGIGRINGWNGRKGKQLRTQTSAHDQCMKPKPGPSSCKRRRSVFSRIFFLFVLVSMNIQAPSDLRQLRLEASTIFHSSCCVVHGGRFSIATLVEAVALPRGCKGSARAKKVEEGGGPAVGRGRKRMPGLQVTKK